MDNNKKHITHFVQNVQHQESHHTFLATVSSFPLIKQLSTTKHMRGDCDTTEGYVREYMSVETFFLDVLCA
jgi:hypothetical protein